MTLKSNAILTVDELLTAMDKSRADFLAGFMSIYNSSADATGATITISGTTLTLVVTGGANAGTSTINLAHADYDTLGELVTAINALAKGWVANRLGASANVSADLESIGATSCLLVANKVPILGYSTSLLEYLINSATDFIEKYTRRSILQGARTEYYDIEPGQKVINLMNYPVKDSASILVYAWDYMTATALVTYAVNTDYALDLDRGSIYLAGGWPVGKQAVKVVYTAGWASADIPWDLKSACVNLCSLAYYRRNKPGIASESYGNYSVTFDLGDGAGGPEMQNGIAVPAVVMAMLKPYRRTLI